HTGGADAPIRSSARCRTFIVRAHKCTKQRLCDFRRKSHRAAVDFDDVVDVTEGDKRSRCRACSRWSRKHRLGVSPLRDGREESAAPGGFGVAATVFGTGKEKRCFAT